MFVPSDASTAFPVFDQPDLKARFTLQIIAPEKWEIVSNTNKDSVTSAKVEETNLPTGTAATLFSETKPISTYVFAFAAGDFAVFDDPAGTAEDLDDHPVSLDFEDLAPSQLHPNTLAFMRAFELVCRYLDIGQAVPAISRIHSGLQETLLCCKVPYP